MSAEEQLSDRALGRALLARQGLLDRLSAPLDDALEAIGAMQGQAWSALPVGLFSRVDDFTPDDLYAALARGRLCWGIGIRGTLHLVSAREHPAYAVVADACGTGSWHRAIGETTLGMRELRAHMLRFASSQSRTSEEIRELAERWVEEHPRAIDAREVQAQREIKWRPIYRWSALLRVPGGDWGTKAPADHRAAPVPPDDAQAPSADAALTALVRAHLRAFGPAAAEDVACWTGARAPAVRKLLDGMAGAGAGELIVLTDEHGRTLHDLSAAPRPDPDTPAPPRLLGAFDSTLLAYAVKYRTRILPPELRDVVYQKANLQIRPTFLIDGLIAGTWSLEVRRGEALLTLQPAGKLPRASRVALVAEADALLAALHPVAKGRHVSVD